VYELPPVHCTPEPKEIQTDTFRNMQKIIRERGLKMINDGYAVCSNAWAIDKDIKNELGLLLIISSLCADKGYCWATNEYLSNLFGETTDSISRKVKKLEEKGYVKVDYERKGTQITKRVIAIDKIVGGDIHHRQNYQSTIDQNVEENNTNIKNIYYYFINKIIKEKSNFSGKEFEIVNQAYMWAMKQPEFNQLSPKEQTNIKMDIYGRYE